MRHHDLASTMVYRKGDRNSDVQARMGTGSLAVFLNRVLRNSPASRFVSGHDFGRADKPFIFDIRAGSSPRGICFSNLAAAS